MLKTVQLYKFKSHRGIQFSNDARLGFIDGFDESHIVNRTYTFVIGRRWAIAFFLGSDRFSYLPDSPKRA